MKQKDFSYLIISMFIIIFIWIIFSIYQNSISSTISPIVNIQIKPINPSFNLNIVNDLKKRDKISPVFEFSASETSSTESGVASESGNLLP